MNETLLLGLLFTMTFFIGYILGRLQKINVGAIETSTKGGLFSKFSKKDLPVEKVSIDETKFVTDVNTNFKKSFDTLGNETKTNDNISSSVAKLSNLKKKK